jgi:hypothetical protein
MTDKFLYQPEGAEWERLPTDLSTAVEQWWEDGPGIAVTQVFEELSCVKIPMPRLDWWLERLAEDICDDTFLDHDDYKHIESIMERHEVLACAAALWAVIHARIDYWQAGDVVRKITVQAWPTGEPEPLTSWNWKIVETPQDAGDTAS